MSWSSSLANFPSAILLLFFIAVFARIWRRCYLTPRHFARVHGCQPVANTLNKEPFLGLDLLPAILRTRKQHKILERNCELFRSHGKTFRLQELHRRVILTVEPENIKTVLSLNFQDYGIGHRFAPFSPLLGEGIFDTDGEQWASSRALIRPSFNRDQIADLTSLESLFQDLLVLLPHDGETEVELQELFFRYTLDAATEFLFNQSVGSLKAIGSEPAFAQAFHYAQKAIMRRGMLGPLNAFFPDRKADECNRICRDFAGRFVEDAIRATEINKQDVANGGSQKHTKHIFSHELASRTSDPQRILDELMNILVAGRDTTASLLSNLFFMLAKSPLIWQQLRAEVASLEGRPPTYEQLHGLKYVKSCISESLRLHPVVPRNERMAVRDTVLPLGGGKDGLHPVFVSKGTLVCYNLYAMHRRKDIYGPDAEEFRPERWFNGTLQPRWGYLPFNGGPRICIGQRFALTEVEYVLVRMVQSFSVLESRDDGPWEESLALTLCSRNGAKVCLNPAE
ncbi:putative cytochrome P450 alkane hydroxylase [Paraphoma chrysanthemicola]|nr:putative cytochrome P450 alkane hydroxylase [Paraphoma chrysanthemicola]